MVPCVTYAKGDHDISHYNNPIHCCTLEKANRGYAAAGSTNLLVCSQGNDLSLSSIHVAIRDLAEALIHSREGRTVHNHT